MFKAVFYTENDKSLSVKHTMKLKNYKTVNVYLQKTVLCHIHCIIFSNDIHWEKSGSNCVIKLQFRKLVKSTIR